MTSRRGVGEGALFQRQSDGLWVGRVELSRGSDGKRRRKVVYGKTKREAMQKLREAADTEAKGLPHLDRRQTVAQWLDGWLASAELAPRSRYTYQRSIERNIKPALGSRPLGELTPGDVERMTAGMVASGLSPATARQARAILRSALKAAERHGLVHRNAASLASPPRNGAVSKTDDTLTAEQAEAVVAAASGHRLAALAVVVLHLGLRQGEALALRWDNVDLGADPTLTVSGSLSRVTGEGLVRGPTKTARSNRTIPLTPTVATALSALKESQAGSSEVVFCSETGTYLDPRNALRIWHEWTQQAGLGKRRMHAARHTTATLLLAAGVPLEVVSAVLGHSGIGITANTYVRVTQDAQRRALATLG